MTKSKMNKVLEKWEKFVITTKKNDVSDNLLREKAKRIEKALEKLASDEIEDEELDEENRCGQLSHGTDGKWVSMDKEDGSLTYPQKPGCNNGKQYKRSGRTPGTEMTPCGRRNRRRKCKG
jgi:hypothetical protein